MQFNRQVNHLSIVSQNSADDDTCVTLTMDGMDRAFDREGNKHFFVQNPPKLEFSRHIFHSFNTYLIKHQQVIIWIYVSQHLDVTFLILVVGIIDFFFRCCGDSWHWVLSFCSYVNSVLNRFGSLVLIRQCWHSKSCPLNWHWIFPSLQKNLSFYLFKKETYQNCLTKVITYFKFL